VPLISEHSLRVTAMLAALMGGAQEDAGVGGVCLVGSVAQRDLLLGLRHRLRLLGHGGFVAFHDLEEDSSNLRVRVGQSTAIFSMITLKLVDSDIVAWGASFGVPLVLVPIAPDDAEIEICSVEPSSLPQLRRGGGANRNAFFVAEGRRQVRLEDWLAEQLAGRPNADA
jgi:hypothetical protein